MPSGLTPPTGCTIDPNMTDPTAPSPRAAAPLQPPGAAVHAAFHSAPGTGPTYAVVGDAYTIRASGAQTNGTLCLLEARVPPHPPGGGPPPHAHANEHESFFILEGTITFFSAAGEIEAVPGTFMHLPKGVPHTFTNRSDREARMLIWCTPAARACTSEVGGFDDFIAEVGVKLADANAAPPKPTDDDIARLMAAIPKYGMRVVDRL